MAKFSRQQYEMIADAINDAFFAADRMGEDALLGVTITKNAIANIFAADNPAFKESVFMDRCYRGFRP